MADAEIAKFDPSTLTDRVRERVRGTIADLIPEDAWTAMVKREVDLFLKETTREAYGYHNAQRVPSGLATAVHGVLEEETKKRVKAMLDSPEWSTRWGSNGALSVQVGALVTQHAPEIMRALLGDAVQRFLNDVRGRIP